MNLYKHVSDSIKQALAETPELAGVDLSSVSVEVPKDRNFGDFSTNAAMILTKVLGKPPRNIAEIILPKIAALDFVAEANIAGPGFINIKIKDEFIWSNVGSHNPPTKICDFRGARDCAQLPRVLSFRRRPEGNNIIAPVGAMGRIFAPLRIDLDYGSYNVAKALHIGHLRGSIIGDTFYRIAKFLGHKPISYNHLGDWGKPMALVIAWIMKKFPNDWNKPDFKINESEFNSYYPAASAYAKEDSKFLAQVLQIKKEFQDGHHDYFALYEKMLKISMSQMNDVVRRLNMLPFDNNLGERNAAQYLGEAEKILDAQNLIQKDDGAEIIALKRDTDNAPMPPFMWKDSRGADTYDSTDLAAVYYKKITDNPDRMIYFSDERQQLHFLQLFRAADISSIFPENKMEFPYFGAINGADGKPYKTRDGNVAGLLDMIQLVNDAVRARVAEAGKNLPSETIEMIALAALKFNDLMHDIKSDYVFDPAQITSFEGRTGPYILYTAVRLNSVLHKAVGAHTCAPLPRSGNNIIALPATGRNYAPLHPSERELLLEILDFERTIQNAFEKRDTSLLANYAYDLAQLANTFYHNCPILRDDVDENTRKHRLQIASTARNTLSTAIELMGLKVPEEM